MKRASFSSNNFDAISSQPRLKSMPIAEALTKAIVQFFPLDNESPGFPCSVKPIPLPDSGTRIYKILTPADEQSQRTVVFSSGSILHVRSSTSFFRPQHTRPYIGRGAATWHFGFVEDPYSRSLEYYLSEIPFLVTVGLLPGMIVNV